MAPTPPPSKSQKSNPQTPELPRVGLNEFRVDGEADRRLWVVSVSAGFTTRTQNVGRKNKTNWRKQKQLLGDFSVVNTIPFVTLRETINKQINDWNHITSNKTMISLRSWHDLLKKEPIMLLIYGTNYQQYENLVLSSESSWGNAPLYRPSMFTAALVYSPFRAMMGLALVYHRLTFNPCLSLGGKK